MDSATKRRLILGLVSNWISKMASSIIQLVQVPFFLHFWATPVFGDSLIVNAVPYYLSFSNIGFGSVAGNEMTMAEARDDRETSLRVFQSCWWLIVIVMCVTGLVALAAIFLVPVGTMLNVHSISEHDTRWIILYLGIAVLVGQLEQLLQSAYRAVGRYPYGSFIKSCMSLGAFAAMLVPVGMHYGPGPPQWSARRPMLPAPCCWRFWCDMTFHGFSMDGAMHSLARSSGCFRWRLRSWAFRWATR